MRLTTVILIASLMQVSAAGFAQKISLSAKNASLSQVFKKIKSQAGVDFLITADLLKQTNNVTIEVKNTELSEVLDRIFKDQPLTYAIEDKFVVVSKKEKVFFQNVLARFQSLELKGIVLNENNQPIAGVTVKEKNTNNSISTGANGRYVLNVKDNEAILTFSFIGYETQEVPIKNLSSPATIVLKVSTTNLKEIVVNKGYYKDSKEMSTGSVGTLKAVDIEKQPVGDPLMALEGRIPGLYVSQTSGVPGGSLNVNIRGLNSISNGTAPLYVVDGVPFNSTSLSQTTNAAGYLALSPFTSIRPNDIESIEVLKDADATAIYGSRGANGVVLITTKKGKAGKTKLDVNVYNGMGKITRKLDLMNTQQFLEMRKEGYKNDNGTIPPFAYDVNGGWDQNRYTDWQKEMIGGTSSTTDAKVSLSGGNELTQFLVGLGYRKETTVFPGDFSNQIGSANLNINHVSENRKMHINFSSNYSNNSNKLPTTDFTSYIFAAPNAPAIYDAKGRLNWENNTFNNPFAYLLQKSKSGTENLINNIDFSFKLIEGLQTKVNLGYSSIKINESTIFPYSSINPASTPADIIRNAFVGYNAVKTWIIEPQINYEKAFGRHHLNVLIASTFQETIQNSLTTSARGFSSDALLENIGAATEISTGTGYSQFKYNAIFSRLAYNYQEKYILNLTGRRDGSSRFGPGRQFGSFGAIGAAWIFSKEQLIKNAFPFLSLGKLRGSIGLTGNDQISDYRFLSAYAPTTGYLGSSGLYPYKIANPYFGWETINKKEIALELGFLKNQIILNTSYYRNRTNNQLVGYSLPDITGYNTIIANLPAVIQNTGLEVDLTTINIQNGKFSWNSSANITVPTNKLVSYPNIEASTYFGQLAVGSPLTMRYLYKYTGIDQSTGLYTVADLDNDGELNSAKDTYPVSFGQKCYGGLSNTFKYKGVSLDVFFQFVKQKGYSFGGIATPGRFIKSGSNMPVAFLNRWQKTGDKAVYQIFSATSGAANASYSNYKLSDALITDASFIRMKNVSLSWDVPKNWTQRITLQNARIYLQAQNLFTITKFEGLDPENLNYGTDPGLAPLKIITAGIQIFL